MKNRFLTMLTAILMLGSSGKLHAAWEFTATAIGGGTVDVTTGTYNEGDTIIVTATPTDATTAFVKWSGDVSEAQKHEPVLRLTCSGGPDGAFNVTSHFGKAWYVATTGDDANDGLTLGTAFATIAKGIASASDGEVVLVDAGNYDVVTTLETDTMTVDKGIAIRSLSGAEQTRVTRTSGDKPTIELSHADAVVEGFHFYKGYSRSVRITTAGGTYRKCIMSGGTFTSGLGLGVYMQGGRISQCIITNNVGSQGSRGAGLFITGGIAESCLISDNSSDGEGSGGGVYMEGGTVRNCTIVNNVSGNGGVYATSGTMENCVVWDNVVQASYSEIVSSGVNAKFFNCYFPPLLTNENTGVFTDCIETNMPPSFYDATNGDFRLRLGSPCLDAGRTNLVVTGECDLDGNDRLVGARVDIGAYEFVFGEDLACDVIAPLTEAVGTLDVILSAVVTNATPEAELTYAWTINGASAGSASTLDLMLTDPGTYTVGLTVEDGFATATTVRTNLLYVAPQTLYVAQESSDEAFPYATPETAATSIQSAIDASRDGCLILIGPGHYVLTSSLEVNKGIEIRSIDGPDNTRVSKKSGYVRLLQLGHSQALITGIDFNEASITVVNIWANGGVVSNCYIRNGSYSVSRGIGLRARSGLVTHCLISDNKGNREGAGVGAYLEGDAVVENCLITNNIVSGDKGTTKGGVYLAGNAVIRNCTIVANQAFNGGGVYTDNGGTVENCIFYDNKIIGTDGPGDPDWYNVGTKAIYRNNCTPIDVGANCVTNSPNFIDAANGDYRISLDSPCFNAGVNVDSLIGGTDYYGNPRIAATFVDIGCHEVVPPPGTMILIR